MSLLRFDTNSISGSLVPFAVLLVFFLCVAVLNPLLNKCQIKGKISRPHSAESQ